MGVQTILQSRCDGEVAQLWQIEAQKGSVSTFRRRLLGFVTESGVTDLNVCTVLTASYRSIVLCGLTESGRLASNPNCGKNAKLSELPLDLCFRSAGWQTTCRSAGIRTLA